MQIRIRILPLTFFQIWTLQRSKLLTNDVTFSFCVYYAYQLWKRFSYIIFSTLSFESFTYILVSCLLYFVIYIVSSLNETFFSPIAVIDLCCDCDSKRKLRPNGKGATQDQAKVEEPQVKYIFTKVLKSHLWWLCLQLAIHPLLNVLHSQFTTWKQKCFNCCALQRTLPVSVLDPLRIFGGLQAIYAPTQNKFEDFSFSICSPGYPGP